VEDAQAARSLVGNDPLSCAEEPDCTWYDDLRQCRPNTPDGSLQACETFTNAGTCNSRKGCSWGGVGDGDSTSVSGGQLLATYKGTATTVIRYLEYNVYTGQMEFSFENTKQHATTVFVKVPFQINQVESETNPVNLQISPSHVTKDEGLIDVVSALTLKTPDTGRDALMQYWQLSMDGDRIQGNLTDNHIPQWVAINNIWALNDLAGGLWMVLPERMAVGTTLEGAMTSTQLQLSVTGQSADTSVQFSTSIDASPEGDVNLPAKPAPGPSPGPTPDQASTSTQTPRPPVGPPTPGASNGTKSVSLECASDCECEDRFGTGWQCQMCEEDPELLDPESCCGCDCGGIEGCRCHCSVCGSSGPILARQLLEEHRSGLRNLKKEKSKKEKQNSKKDKKGESGCTPCRSSQFFPTAGFVCSNEVSQNICPTGSTGTCVDSQ
jgi:hypothetical protein